jgi:DNA-binding transcriptional LysR family regulator
MRRLYNTIFITAGVQPPTPIMETISVRSMEMVLSSEANAIALLPRDVVNELFSGGLIAPLHHRITWTLPPVTFLCQRNLAEQPVFRELAKALSETARAMAQLPAIDR